MYQSSLNNLLRTKSINLTPSNYGVPVEVAPLWKEGLHQQREQIEAFDEEPEVVGHDAVMEENHHCFTAHLQEGSRRRGTQDYIHTGVFEQVTCPESEANPNPDRDF